jgi:ascorbate-specific PTS system EIIC-type component UlaA
MVFLVVVSMIPCLTQRLSPESRKKLKEYYRTAKKYCIRGLFGMVGGTGGYTLLKEAAKDGIKRHGKRYIGGILINSGLTFVSGSIPLITNAIKVVKYSKACHSVCAAAWRASHNIAEVPFLYLANMCLLVKKPTMIFSVEILMC